MFEQLNNLLKPKRRRGGRMENKELSADDALELRFTCVHIAFRKQLREIITNNPGVSKKPKGFFRQLIDRYEGKSIHKYSLNGSQLEQIEALEKRANELYALHRAIKRGNLPIHDQFNSNNSKISRKRCAK